MLDEMMKVASALDDLGMYKEADEIDGMVKESGIGSTVGFFRKPHC